MVVIGLMLALAAPVGGAMARLGQPVMGTILDVTVEAADAATARRLAEDAIAEARHWEDILTTWRPDGELARLNGQAGAGPVTVSADLFQALARMNDLSRATGGAFDPAVGPLVRLWSGRNTPSASALAAIPRRSIGTAVRFAGQRVALAPGTELDAGGIGKGLALDAIAARLRRDGAHAAFLNFGGSSQLAIGKPSGAPDGWPVAVAGLASGTLHGFLHLRDAALSTSRSPGESAGGKIIDPRTRAPIDEARVATVLAPDAASAEAWSKAAIITGQAIVDGAIVDRARPPAIDVLFEDAAGTTRTPGIRLTEQPSSPQDGE